MKSFYMIAALVLCGVGFGQTENGVPETGATGEEAAAVAAQECGVRVRAQVRVCYRHLEVRETPQGRVARRRTGWYVLVHEVYQGNLRVGDYIYYEEEREEPTDLPVFLSDSYTPEPPMECILQAEAAEYYAPGHANLRGVKRLNGAE